MAVSTIQNYEASKDTLSEIDSLNTTIISATKAANHCLSTLKMSRCAKRSENCHDQRC